MTAAFEPSCVRMGPTQFLRIVGAPGTIVTCLNGCLWITRDGCPKDFELVAGQAYRVDGAAPVIVGAFEPSLASVSRPTASQRPALLPHLCEFVMGGRAGRSRSELPQASAMLTSFIEGG